MPQETDLRQVVTFRLGGEEFGIPISDVNEIIFVPAITPIAKAPPSVVGIMNLRGNIIPVIDLRIALRMPVAERTKKQRIIVAQIGGKPTGVMVDEVTQVLHVTEEMLENAPDRVMTSQTRYIRGICKIQDRLIVLLDLGEVLEKDELEFVEKGRNEI
ncbi:MAG: hypothetical protein BLM47_10330 [Candidatus Reconcilbacillus cellulovorans]|uniref:CheW-like domain-containing protein n=1 Tax=Candidatus Reconcilbacillus cellulovorans TaxID=1906605 RepID=A0A2A6DZ98_9BACL|nr:MAG: hypothetical protein BLM47_10330 [Candidatus Reconcilbacillus cellulovorans]